MNLSKSLYLTAALTPTGALFSNSLNILSALGPLAVYFCIRFTPVGFDIFSNGNVLNEFLKSSICLSISSRVSPIIFYLIYFQKIL